MKKPIFREVKKILEEKINKLIDAGEIDDKLLARDTTCRAVTHREEPLLEFAGEQDVMIFVSGRKSSNGKSLFQALNNKHDKAYFIENIEEINRDWFNGAE